MRKKELEKDEEIIDIDDNYDIIVEDTFKNIADKVLGKELDTQTELSFSDIQALSILEAIINYDKERNIEHPLLQYFVISFKKKMISYQRKSRQELKEIYQRVLELKKEENEEMPP